MRNRDLSDISHVFLLVPMKLRTGKNEKKNQITMATIIIPGVEPRFILFTIFL